MTIEYGIVVLLIKRSETMDKKMYYSPVNGIYTNDKSCVPTYKGLDDDIVIESWWDGDKERALDFAYILSNKGFCVDNERNEHFKRYNFDGVFLRKLTLPASFFDEMYERFINH